MDPKLAEDACTRIANLPHILKFPKPGRIRSRRRNNPNLEVNRRHRPVQQLGVKTRNIDRALICSEIGGRSGRARPSRGTRIVDHPGGRRGLTMCGPAPRARTATRPGGNAAGSQGWVVGSGYPEPPTPRPPVGLSPGWCCADPQGRRTPSAMSERAWTRGRRPGGAQEVCGVDAQSSSATHFSMIFWRPRATPRERGGRSSVIVLPAPT